MIYAIDIKKALFFAILFAGLLSAYAVLAHDSQANAYLILNAGANTGCTTEHSHSFTSHQCRADIVGYDTCKADAEAHCAIQPDTGVAWVCTVKDHVGNYCATCLC